MSEGPHPIATSSQTVGPFFHFGLTANANLGLIASPDTPGEHIELSVSVLDGAGAAVPDALIEIYQADAEGRYPDSTRRGESPEPRLPAAARSAEVGAPRTFSGFGRLPTGADGSCRFQTIKPGVVRTNGVEQAPHFNVCLLARGLLRQVYTRIYFTGDPALTSDPILALVPADRRSTLLAEPSASEPGLWEFVIRLQGDDETVFFDL
jgi:protocatechuate 3,4-dioxygenase, alpha subunit